MSKLHVRGLGPEFLAATVAGGVSLYDISSTNNNITPPVTTNVALRNLLRALDPNTTIASSSTSDTIPSGRVPAVSKWNRPATSPNASG